jgi:hypothetical protein
MICYFFGIFDVGEREGEKRERRKCHWREKERERNYVGLSFVSIVGLFICHVLLI